jgi:F0F1-type ATP synthase membrane subunit c/vacuolar-type H+-ATPase subunit K
MKIRRNILDSTLEGDGLHCSKKNNRILSADGKGASFFGSFGDVASGVGNLFSGIFSGLSQWQLAKNTQQTIVANPAQTDSNRTVLFVGIGILLVVVVLVLAFAFKRQ